MPKTIKVLDDFGTYHDALVDDDVFDYLSKFRWYAKAGYAWRSKKPNYLHQAVLLSETKIPRFKDDAVIDHLDRNKLNCTRENLRICDRSVNTRRAGPWRIKRSKFKGVSFHPRIKKWRASIFVRGRQIFVGSYTDEEKAGKAVDYALKKLFPLNEIYLNFPNEDSIPEDAFNIEKSLEKPKLTLTQACLERRKREGCLSQFKGVTPKNKRWVSQINLNGVNFCLGSFSSEAKAKHAYDEVSKLRSFDNNTDFLTKGVYVVYGTFGVGKSWICSQLKDSFQTVSFDVTKEFTLVEVLKLARKSTVPVLVEIPIRPSVYDKLKTLLELHLCVVTESIDVIMDRLVKRGSTGVVRKSVAKRVRAIEKIKDFAFKGTSDEVLNFLKIQVR